jgi:hypothetical protein
MRRPYCRHQKHIGSTWTWQHGHGHGHDNIIHATHIKECGWMNDSTHRSRCMGVDVGGVYHGGMMMLLTWMSMCALTCVRMSPIERADRRDRMEDRWNWMSDGARSSVNMVSSQWSWTDAEKCSDWLNNECTWLVFNWMNNEWKKRMHVRSKCREDGLILHPRCCMHVIHDDVLEKINSCSSCSVFIETRASIYGMDERSWETSENDAWRWRRGWMRLREFTASMGVHEAFSSSK